MEVETFLRRLFNKHLLYPFFFFFFKPLLRDYSLLVVSAFFFLGVKHINRAIKWIGMKQNFINAKCHCGYCNSWAQEESAKGR